MFRYKQIVEDILGKIAEGSLGPGMRLPGITACAKNYKCNKATVIRAYQELEQNHVIYAVSKSGYYVTETRRQEREPSQVIDFSVLNPDIRLLPYKEFNHCINLAVDRYKEDLFLYGDAIGFLPLRKQLVTFFYEDQIFAKEEQFCITSGSQQALNILFQLQYHDHKKKILIEEPTYHYITDMIQQYQLPFETVRRTFEGIDLKEVERIFKKGEISFFYTMPRLHNPMGTSYSEKTKKKLIQLAEKYDVFIIEDDFLGNLNFNQKNLPLYAYGKSDQLIYVQGFSKTFMPGIRIGVTILPIKLVSKFIWIKKLQDLNTSVLEQAAFQLFIESGMYRHHQYKIRIEYRKKMNLVRDYLENIHLPGIAFAIPETGFYFCILFTEKRNLRLLFRSMEANQIKLDQEIRVFTYRGQEVEGIRVSIAKLQPDDLLLGLKKLVELLFSASQFIKN